MADAVFGFAVLILRRRRPTEKAGGQTSLVPNLRRVLKRSYSSLFVVSVRPSTVPVRMYLPPSVFLDDHKNRRTEQKY
jgi:hypothetical protein